MSGHSIPIKDTNNNRIGTLYHKERFTSMRGEFCGLGVYFLDANGIWKFGVADFNTDSLYPKWRQRWCDYAFSWGGFFGINDRYYKNPNHASDTFPTYCTDRTVEIYNQEGRFYENVPCGTTIMGDGLSTAGTNHGDYMRIVGYYLPNGTPVKRYGYYVKTGIYTNSTNTPVYGNWN